MLSKLFPFVLALGLLFSSSALADDDDSPAQFTILSQGQPAPFRGTLFDPLATGIILSQRSYFENRLHVELDYQLSDLTASHQLDLDNLGARYNALDEEYQLTITAKDKEILQLNDSLRKLSRNNRHWFVIGGFAIGVGVTTGIVAAIGSASK
jgi:hypothetical protein